ncbi:MAG: C45 family peptidase [Candidatus Omnitrophota bacterium]|nr:C45 family peptidase [Candidatus Omnitrophota bacterium]
MRGSLVMIERGRWVLTCWFSTGLLLRCFLTPHTSHLTPDTAEAASVEYQDGLPIVYLSGTPYELGYQHGSALREEVRASVSHVLGYFRRYLKIPLVRTWAAHWWLDRPWRAARPFVPPDYLEELKGLADGSGVALRDLYRLHALPDRTYSCANFAAWGRATRHGRLIHARNLDWNIDVGIQQFSTVFVVHSVGKHAFINLGWAGFIGVLTGVNDAQLSIGQVGAETVDATFRGEPMVFVMRRVLEEAGTLEKATDLIRTARRTVGVNYVIADAKARSGLVIETTHRDVRVFAADDPAEHAVVYARPMSDAVFRADTAIDPGIRDRQLASHGDPRRPGLEPPSGSAYEVRYLGQATGLHASFGQLDPLAAQAIAKSIAPSSNVQSVVFAWPELWVANAQRTTPAAQTPYHRLNAQRLLATSKNVE